MNKTVVKIRPSGYSVSQGGSYGTVGFDPLNYKVSNPSSANLIGGGLGAEIIGSVGGVLGGIAGTYVSGANPFVIAGASTAVGGVFKSIGEMIGLGHMKGKGVIPQKYIEFVDRLISNDKTLTEIKKAIMNFELSPELKTRLSKAVSSLLRSMSGNGKKMIKSKKSMNSMKSMKSMKGKGGVFITPNISTYGLVKF